MAHRRGDVGAILEESCGAFGAVGVGIIGGEHEKILTDFRDDLAEERLVTFAAEEHAAGLEIVTRRMAEQILGAVTWIVKMIVHAFDVGRHPADAAFEKGEL